MASPAISVITPTFNRREALARAIRSVQKQTLTDYEHIIVDDCSQDGTDEFVRQLGDKRIRYIRFDRWQGANTARNQGIQVARSERLSFLDSDDEFFPRRLESISETFDANPRTRLILSSFVTEKKTKIRDSRNPHTSLTGAELELLLMSHSLFIAGTSISVRRGTILAAGGFAPKIRRMQDREALLRLARHCGALVRSDIDWVKHVSGDSISGPRSGYVMALGSLMAAHPDLAAAYRELVSYQVARHLVFDLLRGRLWQAWWAWRANQASDHLRFSMTELLQGYRHGTTQRRSISDTLRREDREDCDVSLLRYSRGKITNSRPLIPLSRASG